MKKNKITFKKIYSKIAFLLIIILLFLLIFKILSDGFRVNNLSIAGIKISGLYLKLNEKLILDIDNINLDVISRDTTSPVSMLDIERNVRRVVTLASFFERLNISKIEYANDISSIYFDGKQYKINIPQALLLFKLRYDNDDIFIDIDTLKIKQQNVDVKGNILYLKDDRTFAFDLSLYINNKYDNIINIKGQTDFVYLNIVLNSTNLDSIAMLAPYIKTLDSDVYEWMYEKSSYDRVKVDNAHLVINNINSKNIKQEILNNLYVSGIVENASLSIDETLLPITSNIVNIVFINGKLLFNVNEASYGGVIADVGIIELSGFLDKQTLLKLSIQSKSAILDSRILSILNFYGVNIPINQKDGYDDGVITLDILLPTKNLKTIVYTKGFFKVVNSNVNINGIELFIKQANIYIKDDLVVVSDSYTQFKDILDTKISLVFDINKKTIDLLAKPTFFKVSKGKNNLIDFSNKDIRTKIDFSKENIFIDFADQDASVEIKDDIKVNINDISKLLPYAPILQMLDLKNGNIKLIVKNIDDIVINANLYRLNYPIYSLSGKKINAISINGTFKNGNLYLRDFANRINIKAENDYTIIDFNNLLFDIDEILESKIPLFASMRDKNRIVQNDNKDTNVIIDANNTVVKLFDYQFDIDKGMLKTNKNGFSSSAKYKNGVANIDLNKGTINIRADNFNDEFVNKIFHKEVVKGGTFGLFGVYKDDRFLGDVTMYHTSVKNMTSLQNILTLVDAIPSLVVFKLPGFSSNGYEIDNAKIRIGLNKDFMALEKIFIDGNSVDIEGKGVVDLIKEDINMKLTLSTMKNLSSILNKIPIVGYLLLGDDGKITTEVNVTGKLDNPKTELSLLEDTAKVPVDILKRFFAPFQMLVDELKEESKNR